MAGAAVVLALCVAAPELGSVAGAATPTAAGNSASHPTGSVVLVARHRSRRSLRARRVRAYLKGHPQVAARKLKAHPALLARALHKKGVAVKAPKTKAQTTAKHRKKRKVPAKTKRRRRATAAAAAKKKRRRRAAAAGAVAAKHKKSKKSSGHSLSLVDLLEIGLLVLAPFAAVALLLYITDVQRRPRAPSRTKRRRSLVITPLNKG